jgi:uncharacterized membrane protein YbhN (UPF0104 family)
VSPPPDASADPSPPAPDASRRRRLRLPAWLSIVLRLLVVGGLLAWIASRVDFASFLRTLAAADARWLAAAAVLVVLAHGLGTWRWHRLMRAAGSTWSLARTLAVYAASVFLGLFLPTGVGGDVYRLARVRASGAGLARGAATIVLERAIGLFALLVVGAGFVLAQPGTRPWGAVLVAGIAAGVLGLLALWIPGGVEWLADALERLPGPGRPLAARVRTAFPPGVLDRLRGALAGTVALSIANHLVLIAVNVLLARGLGLDSPWTAIAAAVPLVLLAAQIPIAPGGLGVREAGYVYFLGRVGVAEEPAFALALGWAALLYAVGLLAALGLTADREARSGGAAPPGPRSGE